MNLKKFFSLLLCAGCATLFAASPVDKTQPSRPTQNKVIILEKSNKAESARPKAPSRQVVTCSYDGQYLCFDFVVPEGECNVTVTEWYSNAVQNYTIDSSELSADVYVGELYESTVTVTTANGHTYTADLTAE